MADEKTTTENEELPPYEESPMFLMMAKAYAKSKLRKELSFFEYCNLHLKLDEITVMDHLVELLDDEEDDDFEDEEEA